MSVSWFSQWLSFQFLPEIWERAGQLSEDCGPRAVLALADDSWSPPQGLTSSLHLFWRQRPASSRRSGNAGWADRYRILGEWESWWVLPPGPERMPWCWEDAPQSSKAGCVGAGGLGQCRQRIACGTGSQSSSLPGGTCCLGNFGLKNPSRVWQWVIILERKSAMPAFKASVPRMPIWAWLLELCL